MARELMRRLGGSIAAENRADGGALFTLRFPHASELESLKVIQSEGAATLPPSKRHLTK
jgi:hypothetical protein